MQAIVLFTVLVVSVFAEAPAPFFSSRYSNDQFQGRAPYPAAGFRPAGAQFRLPERQQQVPQTLYVPPPQVYTPQPQETTTTEVPTTTEQDGRQAPNTTENGNDQVNDTSRSDSRNENLTEGSENSFTEEGVYYLYHPSGLLQRVVYSTKNDVQTMGYTAQLRYQNVEPIREPIYTYDPNTFVLQQVQV